MESCSSHHSFLPYCLSTIETDYLESFLPFENSLFLPLPLEIDSDYFLYADPTTAAPETGIATSTLANNLRHSTFFESTQHVSPLPSSASYCAYQLTNTAASQSGISANSSNLSSPAVRNFLQQCPQNWVDSHAGASVDSVPLNDDSLYYNLSYPLSHEQLQNSFSYDPTTTFQPYHTTMMPHPDHLYAQQLSLPQSYPPQPTSPGLAYVSAHSLKRTSSNNPKIVRSQSPYAQKWQPYTIPGSRQLIVPSNDHQATCSSPDGESIELEHEGKEKSRCQLPECGKIIKDLKAHMLTHQDERPEKCPIFSCEYHKRGFARKYDKNRHTLTHYKGTMVCSWCPGSGTSAEKSFNRADVFKRHLMTYHGVEQAIPSGRLKKSPPAISALTPFFPGGAAAGKCPTCGGLFRNPTELYEHLDDCVLLHVQYLDQGESVNERHLKAMNGDEAVQAKFSRNKISTVTSFSNVDDADSSDETGPIQADGGRSSRGQRPGITFRRGNVPPTIKPTRCRKKDCPVGWGYVADNMRVKKQVLAAFDGQRRLVKDDMMLGSDYEVRSRLSGGDTDAYVTDLDVLSLRRADGFYGATDAERGPWVPDNVLDAEIARMMAPGEP